MSISVSRMRDFPRTKSDEYGFYSIRGSSFMKKSPPHMAHLYLDPHVGVYWKAGNFVPW